MLNTKKLAKTIDFNFKNYLKHFQFTLIKKN